MKKIMVTGGAGFIGSHVVEALTQAGHEVAVLDNLSSGKRENVPSQVTFYEGDITDAGFVREAFGEFKPEVVDHHAAQPCVGVSVANPRFDAQQNVLGLINVLEAAKEHKAKRFVMVSSAAVYGDNRNIPLGEDASPSPLSPYAITKLAGERYVRYYATQHGLDAVIFRYANVYGPRQDPHGEAGVVAIFTEKALRCETCKIFGSGEQTRDFVFVKDIARANLIALQGKPGTYNVSTGMEVTINRLFSEFRDLCAGDLQVEHLEPRVGDIFRSVLDSSRIRKNWGWEPNVNLSDNIRETYEWFRSRGFQEEAG